MTGKFGKGRQTPTIWYSLATFFFPKATVQPGIFVKVFPFPQITLKVSLGTVNPRENFAENFHQHNLAEKMLELVRKHLSEGKAKFSANYFLSLITVSLLQDTCHSDLDISSTPRKCWKNETVYHILLTAFCLRSWQLAQCTWCKALPSFWVFNEFSRNSLDSV